MATHWRSILVTLLVKAGENALFYVFTTFFVVYVTRVLRQPRTVALEAAAVGSVVDAIVIFAAGAWSDRIGRKGLSLWSLAITLVVIYPLFAWLAAEPSVLRLVVVQALLSIALSGYYGPFGALIAELFPAHIRSTGLSLAYNIAVMIFGGFGQFIVTWLIRVTESQLAPTFYVMGGLVLSLIAVACIPATRHADVDEARDLTR